MKIEEVITAPQSHWQNAFVERAIGSIRRECLDQVTVPGRKLSAPDIEALLQLLSLLPDSFVVRQYYYRTHLSLAKDAPEPRAKQPPECGPVNEIAEVGGLHHQYERRAT
jgi:putative transposase